MDFKILKKALEKGLSNPMSVGWGIYLIILIIQHFTQEWTFGMIIKYTFYSLWVPLLPITVYYLSLKKEFKKEQDEYNKRISYSTAPSYQTPPRPSAEEHRPTPPRPEPTRETIRNTQERPAEPRKEARATQTPPKDEKPADRPTGRENAQQTERPQPNTSQGATRDRQKRKEDIINGTDILGDRGATNHQQEPTGEKAQSRQERPADDQDEDLDDFEPYIAKPRTKAEEYNSENIVNYPEDGRITLFDIYNSSDFCKLVQTTNRILARAEAEKDNDIEEEAIKLVNNNLGLFKRYLYIMIDPKTSQPINYYIHKEGYPFLYASFQKNVPMWFVETFERVLEEHIKEQPQKEAQRPKDKKPADSPKWGTGGETGAEKPKRGRGRPKKTPS